MLTVRWLLSCSSSFIDSVSPSPQSCDSTGAVGLCVSILVTGSGAVKIWGLPLFLGLHVDPTETLFALLNFLGSWQLCHLSLTAQSLSPVRDQTPVWNKGKPCIDVQIISLWNQGDIYLERINRCLKTWILKIQAFILPFSAVCEYSSSSNSLWKYNL